MSDTGLVWCAGCQTNVKPETGIRSGPTCPQCGSRVRIRGAVLPPSVERPSQPDVEDVLGRSRDIGTGSDDLNLPDGSGGVITTPLNGRLTLNPKVSDDAVTPRCPECEQPIERVERPNTLVEFVCGCGDLRRFDFPEREERDAE